MSTPAPIPEDSPRGFSFALGAYGIWGVLPIYMKAISHLPPVEIIAHRVLWSLPIALAVLIWQRRTDDVMAAMRSPRLMCMALLTAALISANWLIYVWSVANGRTLDAALGYYINPLFSVALGAILLGEKLDKTKLAAVLIALLAVVLLTVKSGGLPLTTLGLVTTWGFYAYLKKSLPLGPNQGFTLEVMILLPFAVALLIWLGASGQGLFGDGSSFDVLMLIGCGPVTAVPLLLYANGAKLLRLSTIGILQYVAPTMIFLTAVFLFNETMDTARMIAFPMIWLALVIYSISLLREAGARRRTRRALDQHRIQ